MQLNNASSTIVFVRLGLLSSKNTPFTMGGLNPPLPQPPLATPQVVILY